MAHTYGEARVSLVFGPETPAVAYQYTYADRGPIGGVTIAGNLELQFTGHEAGITGEIAAVGNLIEALEQVRATMHEQLRQAFGIQALPDGVEPATMADALDGWTSGELAEAFGS